MTSANKSRAVLLLIVVIALLLRLHGLAAQDVWYDEICSIRIAQQPASRVLEVIETTENTPPLYYFILWGWRQVIGGSVSPIAMRLPSVFFGVASIIALYVLLKSLADERAALLAAALLAVSPYHIWFSQEARAYSLLVFLSLLSSIAFFDWLRALNRRATLLYLCSAIALLYTHLYGGAVLLAHGLFLLNDQQNRRRLVRWIGLVLVAGAAFSFYLRALHRWSGRVGGFWIGSNSTDDIFGTLLAFGGSRIAAGAFVAFTAIAVFILFRRKMSAAAEPLFLATFFSAVILPVIVSMMWHPLFLPRYGIVALPAMLGLCAALVMRFNNAWRNIAAVAMLALIAIGNDPGPRQDFRPAMQFVNAHMQPGDTAVLTPKDLTVNFDYLNRRVDVHRVGFRNSIPIDRPLREGEHLWLISNLAQDVARAIESGHFQTVQSHKFGDVIVIELKHHDSPR